MQFIVVERGASLQPSDVPVAFLVVDNWDDWFKFSTMYGLVVFDDMSGRHDIGSVKIGQFGMREEQRRPDLPPRFERLDERFFSLGQDDSYYQNVGSLDDLGREILVGLRDCANDLALFEEATREEVTTTSLLRSVSPLTVRKQFHRLTQGGARLTQYSFSYELPVQDDLRPLELTFQVEPDSQPPSNIHVLIGRNGVGKTRCLNFMTRALVNRTEAAATVGVFSSVDPFEPELFANLVSVTFSAFDPFLPLQERQDRQAGIRYSYIGLKNPGDDIGSGSGSAQAGQDGERRERPPKSMDDLVGEFQTSVRKIRASARTARWRRALQMLEADPLFLEAFGDRLSVAANHEAEEDRQLGQLFQRLSAGHKIVLFTMTRLVEAVDERTLVLVDEPEAHLHPPLLAALIRALSDLLTQRNGVAVIATHSPVVLQEAPGSCVWILRRSGQMR